MLLEALHQSGVQRVQAIPAVGGDLEGRNPLLPFPLRATGVGVPFGLNQRVPAVQSGHLQPSGEAGPLPVITD